MLTKKTAACIKIMLWSVSSFCQAQGWIVQVAAGTHWTRDNGYYTRLITQITKQGVFLSQLESTFIFVDYSTSQHSLPYLSR